MVTDIGSVTNVVRERLKNCSAVIVEANHDEQMLRDAARPWALKQRIASRQGHLSNKSAAELIGDVAGSQLTHVFLAHMSNDCNRLDIAVDAVQKKLFERGFRQIKILPTYRDRPSEVCAIDD